MGLQSATEEEEYTMTGQNHQQREIAVLVYFIIIVICARQTLCLINEKLAAEPTMSEDFSPNTIEDNWNATVFNYSLPACGDNSHYCMGLCEVCHDFFNGNMTFCLWNLLESQCLSNFHSAMTQSNGDWCVWGNVSGLYSNLSICTEEISDCLVIPWPNPLVEQTFLDIHMQYFQDCPSEELSDPPPGIVFALVITPICLIPVMVSLVVLKTKNGDGSQ